MDCKILIVEDEPKLRSVLCDYFINRQDVPTEAENGIRALELLREYDYDAVLLDVMMPHLDGFSVCRAARKVSDVPILFLTALSDEEDQLCGYELGADDYITKPFSLAVLRARVNAQLRRSISAKPSCTEIDGFQFDFDRMEFRKDGQLVELSKTEQKLLRILVENRGQTLTRAVLVDRIWTDGADYVDENALSVTVKRLRDKLEDTPSSPKYLKTVYGIGYTWAVK